MTDTPKQYVALIGDLRIPTSAAVVEIYRKVFTDLPVRFVEVVDLPEVPE